MCSAVSRWAAWAEGLVASLALPPTLQARLDGLPRGLALHVDRVRGIARALATAHSIDPDLAELTAAAHDVARHIAGDRLIIRQDGKELASSRFSLQDRERFQRSKVNWGKGVFGKLNGRITKKSRR